MTYKEDEKEAYQRWKRWGLVPSKNNPFVSDYSNDFVPLSNGPLIRDSKTSMVWDSTEFQYRALVEEGKWE
jgi:hypothetical protein